MTALNSVTSAYSSEVSDNVLVLNASWEPLAVVARERAICLIYGEEAETVLESDDVWHSQNEAIIVPSIIRLKRMVKVPRTRTVPLSRRALFSRDNHTCAYCGVRPVKLTIDHVVPRAQGGKNTWLNVVSACTPCNSRKRDRTPDEAGMKLLFRPSVPTRMGLIALRGTPEWAPYIGELAS